MVEDPLDGVGVGDGDDDGAAGQAEAREIAVIGAYGGEGLGDPATQEVEHGAEEGQASGAWELTEGLSRHRRGSRGSRG
jgi:hypothetical protein